MCARHAILRTRRECQVVAARFATPMREERSTSGVLATLGCLGVSALTYGGAYLVVRVAHVLVNHGYQRIRSAHWGITVWDLVFAPMTALEEWARGFH